MKFLSRFTLWLLLVGLWIPLIPPAQAQQIVISNVQALSIHDREVLDRLERLQGRPNVDDRAVPEEEHIAIDDRVVISWETSVPTHGTVEYGLTTNYDQSYTDASSLRTKHQVRLEKLQESKIYHFRILATTETELAATFDFTFKTGKKSLSEDPVTITDVMRATVTGTTLTVQWRTDIPASSIVLMRESGSTAAFKRKTDTKEKTLHDITFTGLKPDMHYEWYIRSETKAKRFDETDESIIRTDQYSTAEKSKLIIDDPRPIQVGDDLIGVTDTSIRWTTNILANSSIRWGTAANRLGSSLKLDTPRRFNHSYTLTGLKPDTIYYAEIASRDIFGVTVKQSLNWRTLPPLPTSTTPIITPPVSHGDDRVTKATKLVKATRQPAVYAVYGNKKLVIPSEPVFRSYGYSFNNVVTESPDAINRYVDVRLVRAIGSSSVYAITPQRQRQSFTNGQTFLARGFRWEDIVTITPEHLAWFETELPTLGELIRTSDNPAVFWVQNGARRLVPSAEIFINRGWRWDDVVVVPHEYLNSIQVGESL